MLESAVPERRPVWLSEFYPLICETLSSGGQFRLTVTGTSMIPTLKGGRDCVTLVQAPARLSPCDLPLYRRTDGSFVLHRVIECAPDGSYVLCGDHQWTLEPGIRPEQIVGLATEITRKGKAFSVDSPTYRRWVRFWVWALPMRRVIFRVCGLPGAVERRIFKKKRELSCKNT